MSIPPDFHADRFAYAHRSTVRGWLAFRLSTLFPRTRARVLAELRAVSVASAELAGKLQEIIAQRLETSREPARELERVVAELRDMGHPIELDENGRDWTIYADRPHRNLAVWVHWDDVDHMRVAQTEVLWQRM
ncbi:MAG: hypothetical protein SFX73_40915 [Kofleriaceae bacterium]|nr:hypothetical protein [Kofleriaceae bacterium]